MKQSSHELATMLLQSILALGRRLRAERPPGSVSLSALVILGQLHRQGILVATRLAKLERLQPQSLTRLLAELELEGLITRKRSEADRREIEIVLTAKGRIALLQDMMVRRAWLEGAMAQALTKAEREAMVAASVAMAKLASYEPLVQVEKVSLIPSSFKENAMKIGLQLPNFTWAGGPRKIAPTLGAIARAADDSGFYSLWVMDHFFQIALVGPPEHDMLEGYNVLGYLAALTTRVKLGTMVTGVIYRYPGILLKTVTTLDVLSQGRAYLGIGAAWNEAEATGLGVPFPAIGVRMELLEETLQIAKQMWSANDDPFHGKHNHLSRTLCSPQPLSRPHPPILVAGGGEKKTLRLVAQYADACNLYGPPETVRAKLAVLKQHCDTLGRDYDRIEKTTLGTAELSSGKTSAQEIVSLCGALAELGVTHALFNLPNVEEIAPLEVFARDIIPAVANF